MVYQIYPRSFADHNGDGVGDIAGMIDKLPYVVGLGVDAVWVSPWYPSPMADAGYDVSDYRDIDPDFGNAGRRPTSSSTGARARLAGDARHRAEPLRDAHPWFRAALAAPAGSPSAIGTSSATVGAERR